jgi:hypothetical protein
MRQSNPHATIEGWLEWQLWSRKHGHFGPLVHRKGGEQHNLILNGGLDSMFSGSGFNNMNATNHPTFQASVGTGSTAPAVTDTNLETLLASTTATGGISSTIQNIANGLYEFTRVREFDFSEAIGALTEWAFRKQGVTQPFTRELFRDGSSNPVVVNQASALSCDCTTSHV